MRREPYILDHVAFGVPDAAAVTPFLVGKLGGRPFEAGPGAGFLWWQWRFARGARLEVLEPSGPPGGFVHRFLAARGPGVHHVTFKVPDLAVAAARVRASGYEVVGYNDESPSWKECFLHPKQAHGIVVQLAEAHPEFETEPPGSFEFPASPPGRGAAADVLGLRLSAAAESTARHQWEMTLCGSCERTDAGLRFHWGDSPLRIDVRIDPAQPEGPVAVEIASADAARLPDRPQPQLGIPFLAAADA